MGLGAKDTTIANDEDLEDINGAQSHSHGYSFPFLLLRGKRHERLLISSPPTSWLLSWLSSSATEQMSNVTVLRCIVPIQALFEEDGISIFMPSRYFGFT